MGPKVDNIYTIRAGLLQMVSYLGFIHNYKEPQLRLVFLRYSANVASTFPWVVTYGIRVGPVTPVWAWRHYPTKWALTRTLGI